MKERVATTQQQLDKAANDLRALGDHLPLVITVTEGKRIRSEGQNSRHWVSINHLRQELQKAVDQIAEHTGHTQLEVKRLIAEELEPEQIAILYARTNEVIHEVLKQIVNIPTSTRLGTAEFSKFDQRLDQVMAEIIGIVRAFVGRALS